MLALAHVKPKPGLARFFYGNGVDDDGDGTVDEGPEFEDDGLGGQILVDFGEIAEPGLQGEGVGEFVDSEYNRDLNYTRWLVSPRSGKRGQKPLGSLVSVGGRSSVGCTNMPFSSPRR